MYFIGLEIKAKYVTNEEFYNNKSYQLYNIDNVLTRAFNKLI